MIGQDSVLVQLIRLVERIPTPPTPPRPPRGRPVVYPERLFLKALVIMIVRRLHKVGELLAVLEEPTPEMKCVRELLEEGGRFPCRRTFERRLKALPQTLPEQIGCLGRYLVAVLKPWASTGRAVALDSTVLRAKGGEWHKKDREAGVVPHSAIDTEAHWGKSGWHGWVYGWKLHLALTVAGVWIPLAARLTPANASDNTVAPLLIEALPEEARFVLGDTHYDAEELREACLRDGRFLVTTKRGPYPHTDAGVEVRRIFHQLRSRAIENFNGQFKSIFDGHAQVPTKGLVATARFALGAVLVYQLALLHRYEHERDLRVGLKAFLKAA
ncbi:MAG: transposase [Actinomycetota bacterium]|nr:transposase [Actinomycetota bacterium]